MTREGCYLARLFICCSKQIQGNSSCKKLLEIFLKSDSPKITNRRITQIAIPMMLSNITVPLLGFVDTAVIGQLGQAELIAALGLGSILISALYWLCGFLRMGTTGLAAQAKGADDSKEICQILIRGLVLGAVLGFLVLLIAIPVFHVFFIVSPADALVENHALAYVQIRILSAPFAIANITIIGWLIAMEKAVRVFLIQLIVNVLNLSLNVIFVLVWDYGVEGIAYATLISEVFGLFFSVIMCRGVLNFGSSLVLKGIFDYDKWANLFALNLNIFLRSLLLEVVFLSFFFWGASFGTIVLAANQILIQFLHIFAYALDGFAFSAEVLVGVSYGRKSIVDLRESVLLCTKWAALTAICISLGFSFLGPILVELMTTSNEVVAAAKKYLLWVTLAPLFSFAAYIMDGVFFGSTHTSAMRKAMIMSTGFYFFTAVIFSNIYQNHGLWLSLSIFLLVRALTLFYYYPNIERSVSSIRY